MGPGLPGLGATARRALDNSSYMGLPPPMSGKAHDKTG